MCALFGFVARRNPDQPKPSAAATWRASIMQAMVRANVGRGPHAFGFAWVDSRGRLRMFKQTGRLSDQLGVLAMAADARMLVGHLRFATHGDPEDNANNHPHPVDGGWLVHNGVIRNHDRLARAHELRTTTDCDSEVLGLLAERVDEIEGTPAAQATRLWRMARAAEMCEGALAALALWSRPAGLVAVRRGNPLHWASADEGVYLATLADGLPAGARALADNRAYRIAQRGERIVTTTCELDAPVESWSYSRGGAYRGG